MRILCGLFLVSLLAFVGCTPEQHEGAAAKAESTKVIVDEIRNVIGSETGKVIAAAISTIPVPGAQIVPVAREKVEWGLGILSAVLTAFAGWQTKKATDERYKKKIYKDNSTKTELDTANKVIYGDKFKAELSK